MKAEDFQKLISQGENEHVEFKTGIRRLSLLPGLYARF